MSNFISCFRLTKRLRSQQYLNGYIITALSLTTTPRPLPNSRFSTRTFCTSRKSTKMRSSSILTRRRMQRRSGRNELKVTLSKGRYLAEDPVRLRLTTWRTTTLITTRPADRRHAPPAHYSIRLMLCIAKYATSRSFDVNI